MNSDSGPLTMRRLSARAKAGLVIGVALGVCAGVLLFVSPVAQPASYHDFADRRPLLAVPNAGDVLSNAGFLVVGLLGFAATRRGRFVAPPERIAWYVLFTGVFLTAFGSAYYHWSPSNETLVWDRLPMTLGFMALVSAIISERIHVSAGITSLPILLLAGAASVIYWIWSEHGGAGDLRPYALVQFLPALIIPFIIILYQPRYTRTGDLGLAALGYLAAKLFEAADRPVFLLRHVVSGHTLKHLAAAVGIWFLARMLTRRTPIELGCLHVYEVSRAQKK